MDSAAHVRSAHVRPILGHRFFVAAKCWRTRELERRLLRMTIRSPKPSKRKFTWGRLVIPRICY